MTAFNSDSTPAREFTDVDGRTVTVRPVRDDGLGRVLLELTVNGSTARLSLGLIPQFSDTVLLASAFGEISNVAEGNPSPIGK
jgi:hypothetical protein